VAAFAPELIPTLWINLALLGFSALSFWAAKRGSVQLASLLVCLPIWMLMVSYLSVGGGVTSPGFGFLSVVIIVAAVLLGTSGAVTFGVLCIVTGGILYWAGGNGWLSVMENSLTPGRQFATQTIIFLSLTVLMALSERNVRQALARAQDSERALAERNRELQQELSERKRAEEALAVQRNLLRTVIDTLPDFVYAKDTESHFTLVNAALARSVGDRFRPFP